ncbi:HD domain-containing protein [uncultured virus]|nr:HD domain-containing protein [uncultured virus]
MSKIVKDCIYGHIHIPELCVKFMDVPEFQRLRRVRQLGMTHYVYPSAVHTRLEHSLGVMHLAGKMVDQLRVSVNISDRTKHLIQLAGMYHDIGHFAFSHLFDRFLQKVPLNETVHEIFTLKDHEDRSIFFLRQVNARLKLLTEEEEEFVEDVIHGRSDQRPRLRCNELNLAGCDGNSTPYLYQIVCNSECGIDVDKMDYLNRDTEHTGLPGFQSDYIILATVIDDDDHIAFKNKARRDISDLYEARKRMYENVYHHHATTKIDKMYFCFMKRLGSKLFQYGERTDDYNIETLIRNSTETADLVQQLESRGLSHDCDCCKEYGTKITYKPSGTLEQVRFV